MNTHLNKIELDQLAEVANIGAHNASTVLSKMLHQRLVIDVPEILIERIEKIVSLLGRPEDLKTAVLVKILGDVPGMIILIFSPASARALANLLTGEKGEDMKMLTEIDRSALRETGNILSGASLAALSKFLGVNLLQSVPDIATDMLGALMDEVLSVIGRESDIGLVLKANFLVEKERISGDIFFIFDPRSTRKILELAKKKIGN
jgi:chemotaxis protein CheC